MKLKALSFLRVATPIGEFIVAAQGDALKGGWFVPQKYFPDMSDWQEQKLPVLVEARRQLDAYFAGKLTVFDLPLALEGTDFQQKVWRALLEIPASETTTYGDLARRIGHGRAFHAVGAAVGRNPLSVIVPCHRALGSTGSLTGYAGGLDRKRWLLDHESRAGVLFA